ncbi:MAG: hypothetical protein JSV50_08340 [Desulfobacteraceae bacterium]|nr:MAG: hypothetical protein JSV50_08340 [Desulfobacteraceae bacterium]
MSSNSKKGTTGIFSWFLTPKYEKRRIVIAEGIEFHESDIGYHSVFGYLKYKLGKKFIVDSSGQKAEFYNEDQKVHYILKVVHKKSEFKKAVETEGIIVIYAGHSRYGRGACFDQYTGSFAVKGDQWENGNDGEDGLFRLGYTFVPVAINDIRSHQYRFAPVPVMSVKGRGRPKRKKRHPFNFERVFRSKRLRIFRLPEDLHKFVISKYKSDSDKYYGFYKREKKKSVRYLILNGGWQNTQSPANELGTVTIKCRTFCHFGCSSKQHFWHIIRHRKYKGWKRPKPPTEKFAYFTTAPGILWHLWTYYLLTFDEENDPDNNAIHWWRSHQFAKKKTNDLLKADGRPHFQVY